MLQHDHGVQKMMQVISKWSITIDFQTGPPQSFFISDNFHQNVLTTLAKIDFGSQVTSIKIALIKQHVQQTSEIK